MSGRCAGGDDLTSSFLHHNLNHILRYRHTRTSPARDAALERSPRPAHAASRPLGRSYNSPPKPRTEPGFRRSEPRSRPHPRTKPAAGVRRVATFGSLLPKRAPTTNGARPFRRSEPRSRPHPRTKPAASARRGREPLGRLLQRAPPNHERSQDFVGASPARDPTLERSPRPAYGRRRGPLSSLYPPQAAPRPRNGARPFVGARPALAATAPRTKRAPAAAHTPRRGPFGGRSYTKARRADQRMERGLSRSEPRSRPHPRTKPAAGIRRVATFGSLLPKRAPTTNGARPFRRSEPRSRPHPRTKPAASARRVATFGSLLQQPAQTTN